VRASALVLAYCLAFAMSQSVSPAPIRAHAALNFSMQSSRSEPCPLSRVRDGRPYTAAYCYFADISKKNIPWWLVVLAFVALAIDWRTRNGGWNVLPVAAFGGIVGYLIWYFAPRSLKGESDPTPKNNTPESKPQLDLSQGKQGIAGPVTTLAILGILWFIFQMAIAVFILLLIYGVIVIIFRSAFGIELPNPF
jgi:hypothetical protein